MKIAIFGGSFDPVHAGHEAVVKEALKTLAVDRLFIVPTFISPHKSAFAAPPALRLRWLAMVFGACMSELSAAGDLEAAGQLAVPERLVCADERVQILGCEINAARPVPSIETARAIAAQHPSSELFFIIGADHLEQLHSWHEIAALRALARFVVASRDGREIPSEFLRLEVAEDVSSSDIRRLLKQEKVDSKIIKEVKNFYGEKI